MNEEKYIECLNCHWYGYTDDLKYNTGESEDVPVKKTMCPNCGHDTDN